MATNTTRVRLNLIYGEVTDARRMRLEPGLPQRLEKLTSDLFDCFAQERAALQESVRGRLTRRNQSSPEYAVDRWWLWVDFALRAFAELGPFRRRFAGPINPKAAPTCSHRRRFLEASSNFLSALLDCLDASTSAEPGAEVTSKLLKDSAWLFAEYGALEYGVPRELPIAQALECFCQEKAVYPEAWCFAIGQFFHAVDVWLLGDLLLRSNIDRMTLAENIGKEISKDHELESLKKMVHANHFVAAIFHDVGRVCSYVPRIWESVPTLAQVLLPDEEPSIAALSANALNLARETNWGSSLTTTDEVDHGAISHYLLYKAVSRVFVGKQEQFEGALDAIGYHNRFDSEAAYVSCPIAVLFAIVDALCIPDNDEEDPLARRAALGAVEREYSLRNLLRYHSPVEQLKSSIFPGEPGKTGNFEVQSGSSDDGSCNITAISRQGSVDRFCVQLNWLYACRNWARMDLQGCPFKLRVAFLNPYNLEQVAGKSPPRMEELRDYFSIRPRSAKAFWPDSSEAIEYQRKDSFEKLIVDVWRLSEERIAANELNIKWEDFVAWSVLRRLELV